MNRTTEIIRINSSKELPSLGTIREIPREKTLKLIFESSVRQQRKIIGENLKTELLGFQVGIHMIEPEINIAKLITDEEIELNQSFFEKCAKDYRNLGEKLIFDFAENMGIEIQADFPLRSFTKLKMSSKQSGSIGQWNYFLHGYHCGFEHKKTKQYIEVPLVFSLEFGDLDPYFYTKFIKSTHEYHPLPVEIYEDYADGARINEKMLSLGKFERINSNIENHFGIVVTDREKVEIKIYEGEIFKKEKRIFNFWKFLRLK